jgi:hypothetical protein
MIQERVSFDLPPTKEEEHKEYVRWRDQFRKELLPCDPELYFHLDDRIVYKVIPLPLNPELP